MYPLFHLQNPRRVPILPPAAIKDFKSKHNFEKLKLECELLNWALEHKDFDFKSILDFHQSNEDIVCFIMNLADLYDRERLFEMSRLKCSEKQLKTESDEQYLKDNYVDTPQRLGHLSSLDSQVTWTVMVESNKVE